MDWWTRAVYCTMLGMLGCGEANPKPASHEATAGSMGSTGTEATSTDGSTNLVSSTTGTSSSGGSVGSVSSSNTTHAGSGGVSTGGGPSTLSTNSTGGVAGSATSTNAGGGSGGGGGMSSSGAGGTGIAPDCQGEKVVHFVYFVESDVEYSESLESDIEQQAFAFQQYWYDELGVTFYLNWPVVDVIQADHASDWYLTTPDGIHGEERWYRLGNVKNEVYQKLGIQNFDPNHRVVNYPTTRHDGRVGANFGGAWMDGDDLSCIGQDNGVNYPYDDGNDAHCMGHVAHEFGHVLGLDHQGPQTDCMQFGFYNSYGGPGMCEFSAENVAQILADPDNEGWLTAEPGDTCVGL